MPNPNIGPSMAKANPPIVGEKGKSAPTNHVCCFGIASFLLIAAAAWLTTTIGIDGGIKNWTLFALVYGAVNITAGILMVGATMKPEILERGILCGRFELGSLAAFLLTLYDGVSVGLLTFLRESSFTPIATPLVVGSTNVVAYQAQSYFAAWSIFIFAMSALLCVGDTVKIPLLGGAFTCPASSTLFVAAVFSALSFISPFDNGVSHATTGIAMSSALAGLTLIKLSTPMMDLKGLFIKVYCFVLMGLAVATFVYTTYEGPTFTLGNAYFATLVAAFAGVYLYAKRLY